MSKDIIIAKGLFSTFTIKVNDDVMDNLAYKIDPKRNPLKVVEDELQHILNKFERAYFDAVNIEGVEGTIK